MGGSYIQGPMDRVSILALKECWRMFYTTTILKDVGSYIQGPMDGVSIIELKECWKMFYTTTILKDVGSYIQGPMDRVSIIELKECWRMFLHHNNIKGCWILYPRSDGSSVHRTLDIRSNIL